MPNHKLLTYKEMKPGYLLFELDLLQLYDSKDQLAAFRVRFKEFLKSDPYNREIYRLREDLLEFNSEQLIPPKADSRPPLLMIFGNPASHSVKSGMFFAFKENGKENRFWKNLLRLAGILDMDLDEGSAANMNKQMMTRMLAGDYVSPFRIGLCVYISMPSAAGGAWSGVAGIRKLLGSKAISKLENDERKRIKNCAKKFLGPGGVAVAFQKNAWEGLRSESDPPYSIELAKRGKLKGSLDSMPDVPLYGVPPTRLIGPCRKVLRRLLVKENLTGPR